MRFVVRHAILALTAVAALVALFARPALPQPLDYHLMADERVFLGIPNLLNVASNLPFAIVGIVGLAVVLRAGHPGTPRFRDPWERRPYVALFAGVALTCFGSAFYHLAPDNARLVWDRLPMTVGFMGLLTALFAERVSLRGAKWLFGPLLAFGAASVVYWYWSETRNAGDLRPYLFVQFGSLLLIVAMLILYPARYPGTRYLAGALAAYAAAKLLEEVDDEIFAVGHIVSGHTLKHLAAAGGVALLVAMLRERSKPETSPRAVP